MGRKDERRFREEKSRPSLAHTRSRESSLVREGKGEEEGKGTTERIENRRREWDWGVRETERGAA